MIEPIFAPGSLTPQSHASTLARTGSGWLAAWFAGTAEGHTDMAIWTSAWRPGIGWSTPCRRFKVDDAAHWNPVLLASPGGRVHVWFKVGNNCVGWRTWTACSDDEGATWTAPRLHLPDDALARGPVRCQPIVLSDGAWLSGGSDEGVCEDDGRTWWPFVERSDDQGQTWHLARLAHDPDSPPGLGGIQPTLWESPRGAHCFLRTGTGQIFRADSTDGGRSWCRAYATGLPNNNSSIAVARLACGALAMAWNPLSGSWGTPRTPLRLSLSWDNGTRWTHHLDLATGPGEFSYPAVLAFDEQIAVSWTHNRACISWWRGTASDIPAGEVESATVSA